MRYKHNILLRNTKNSNNNNNNNNENEASSSPQKTKKNKKASKREMLNFAIPALGIYLTSPLLSNIDNAFVGRTIGTSGLAALSPATICTDQMLYLFSFLSRATTGIVSSAFGTAAAKVEGDDGNNNDDEGNVKAAKEAASAPFTISLLTGIFLTIFYMIFTKPLLSSGLRINPSLLPNASSYVYIRGLTSWAALSQSVCLSILMATRDAITPLKIIALSALVNVVGDALFCVWPIPNGGCAGAAAATSIATLLSYTFMIRALKRKQLLPKLRKPTIAEFKSLLDFTGPLMAITLTRLAGFIVMQKSAMKLGVQNLAAYQLCINLVIFFLLFGEPLSQLSQTKLPALLSKVSTSTTQTKGDDKSEEKEENTAAAAAAVGEGGEIGEQVLATFKSILTLAMYTAISIGGVASCAIAFGSGCFSSDIEVMKLAKGASPAVFMTVATAIFTVAVDGAMLASRDFGFMLTCGLSSFALQLFLLTRHCSSLSFIFATFTMRLGTYSLLALMRVLLFGGGTLGRVISSGKKRKSTEIVAA